MDERRWLSVRIDEKMRSWGVQHKDEKQARVQRCRSPCFCLPRKDNRASSHGLEAKRWVLRLCELVVMVGGVTKAKMASSHNRDDFQPKHR